MPPTTEECPKLAEFISFLNGLTRDDFTGSAVEDYLTDRDPCEFGFGDYLFFREDTCGRNLIARTPLYELIALTWLPNHQTPLHSYLGHRSWMFLYAGELSLKNYRVGENELLPAPGPETCVEGGGLYIDYEKGVHQLINTSKKPAVSIHLYAGPADACYIYDEKRKIFELAELKYFTRHDQKWEKSAPEDPSPSGFES